MTFQQMVADICGRLNLVSAEATARVGQELNQHYRKVTATIGLEQLRYVSRSATTALDSDKVTFAGIEKIDRVYERGADGLVRVLVPVLLAQIRESQDAQGSRHQYAIWQQDADSITILLPGLALAITDLYADGWTTLAELAGSDEPTIPASFHRILIDSVMGDEYLRKEKTSLADRYYATAEAGLRELRFHLADAPAREFRQGDQVIPGAGGGGTGGAGSSVITGDIVFDRDPAPPFHVTAGSGLVENLDADKLDGQHGAFYQNASNLNAGTVPPAQIGPNSVTFDKLADLQANKLLGRGGSGPGDPEPITVGSGLGLIGTVLQATPLPPIAHGFTHNSGGPDPVTALSAAVLTSGTLDPARLAAGSVTNDKLTDLAPSQLLGRNSGAPGDPEPITLGAGLSIAGTVLSAATAVPHHETHEPGGSDALTLSEPSMLLGRGNAGAVDGPVQEITLGPNLYMDGTTLRAKVSSSQLFNYDWSVTQTPPPTSSQLRVNAAHPYTLATELYVRPITSDGIDVYWSLMRIKAGTGLFVQDKNDHAAYFEVRTVGVPVDNGTHITFTTTPIGSGATALLNNQSVVLVIGSQPDAGVAAHAPTHAAGASDPVDVKTLGGFPGTTNEYLRGDGTFNVPAGGTGGGAVVPGGVAGAVQFNDAGAFAGDAGLTFDKVTKEVTAFALTASYLGVANNGSVNGSLSVGSLHSYLDVGIDGKLTVNGASVAVKGVRPEINLQHTGSTTKARVMVPVADVASLSINATYDGTAWQRDDPSKTGIAVALLPGGLFVARLDGGGYANVFSIDPAGMVSMRRPVNMLGAPPTFAAPNLSFDLATGSAFVAAGISGPFTNVFLNPPPVGVELVFSIQYDVAAATTPSWPASVTWDEDVVPVFPGAGRSIILGFSTVNGGARWRGYIGGRNFAT